MPTAKKTSTKKPAAKKKAPAKKAPAKKKAAPKKVFPKPEPHSCPSLELQLGQLFNSSREASKKGDQRAAKRVDAIRVLFSLL
ncbi:MAG: hypothetical protein JSU89_09570 [Myxococcales bacterium]|nr:MAG: hypothetical protein JSU89_09570 [Myxococcales bacterium]